MNVIKHRLQFEVCISNLDYHDKIVHFSPEIVSWLKSPVSLIILNIKRKIIYPTVFDFR